ncbi:hypothetical protein [Leptothoe spongobia]|uniref:Uncharacterized protein n=1 Tax=Leptothoe spongobia TAU-MAC 1115 TaxID=1967444 RepID=A0A947DI50_9CYAN|nr:hypothetical protein [Leptothoe spongobia]MBT9317617.1 hypothetical protein [Leptothoe spongobia TAU-MAC 1115]
MADNLPAAQSASNSAEDSQVQRIAARRTRIQKILQLLGLSTGSIGLAPTILLLKQGQWGLAVLVGLASIGVIVLALAYKFLTDLINRILDRIEEKLDASSDSLAAWIVAQLETAAINFWWKITPQFKGEYYKSLIYGYRSYRTQGLKTPGDFKPDLDKVFVPLRITSKSLEQISPALIQRQETAGDLEIWDFLGASKDQSASGLKPISQEQTIRNPD